ncbi:hypothetical protein [Lactobacillus hominis]|uniref:Uncharacterized protein n=1 Tax=Lactobacillus hominis DSM 23910 = CRBIP 24.179 TaxID=1423758 RepID=I7IVT6_9LACO|nr:hypothetical protein [Lactobacillus hominis]KRM85769.1 hypothetical protein FC41_GL001084 [Lactobacillus hominis DSM 23910 = CRBIP 24.179]MCT3347185.1 hypothetical protein [Lactobacillus hominis]CCI82008.1 Protein of unknown function [Lactobacillus hominis DSM 23910 = CRBIP 24.179]
MFFKLRTANYIGLRTANYIGIDEYLEKIKDNGFQMLRQLDEVDDPVYKIKIEKVEDLQLLAKITDNELILGFNGTSEFEAFPDFKIPEETEENKAIGTITIYDDWIE